MQHNVSDCMHLPLPLLVASMLMYSMLVLQVMRLPMQGAEHVCRTGQLPYLSPCAYACTCLLQLVPFVILTLLSTLIKSNALHVTARLCTQTVLSV